MKIYMNAEVEIINLSEIDIIATSDPGKNDVDWDLTGYNFE